MRFLVRAVFLGLAAILGISTVSPYAVGALHAKLQPSAIIGFIHTDPVSDVQGSPPHWIHNTHRILYARTQGATPASWICTYDVDSHARKTLLQGYFPVPSPDGTKFLYIAKVQPQGASAAIPTLYVADIDGTHVHQVLPPSTSFSAPGRFSDTAAWSPDSKRIAYLRTSTPAAPHRAADVVVYPSDFKKSSFPTTTSIYLVNSDGSGNTRVATFPNETLVSLAWLNASTLLFNAGYEVAQAAGQSENIRAKVASYSIITHKQHVLLDSRYGTQSEQYPVASPTGQFVAFWNAGLGDLRVWYPSKRQLSLYNVASKRVTPVLSNAHPPAVGGAVAWMHDGRGMFFLAGVASQSSIYRSDLRGKYSVRAKLPAQGSKGMTLALSSDGRYLAWTAIDNYDALALWVGRSNGSGIQRVDVLHEPLAGVTHGKVTIVHWKSTNGVVVDGYLAYPVGYRAGRRYPTVMIVHGGSCCNNYPSPDEWPGGVLFEQFLAQHGYAVFLPDYRSSGDLGFDKVLAERGIGLKPDFEDLMTGLDALEKSGVADPSHLYILGHSAGSFLTNYVLAHTHRFRAAVSYEGGDYLADWARLGPNAATTWFFKGTPFDNFRVYRENSPLFAANSITTPTIFVNAESGIDDQAMEWLYGTLRYKGIDTRYLFYKGEGHNLAKPNNQLDLFERTFNWIQKH